MNLLEWMSPAIAAIVLEENICSRCTNNGGIQNEAGVLNDIAICHSSRCPLRKFHEAIGFTISGMAYKYPTGTEKINPLEKINGKRA